MAIMGQMRSQMKTILWILVFAFLATIVFSWGMGGFRSRAEEGIMGVINGEKVRYEEFENLARIRQQAEERKAGGTLDEAKVKQLREDVWDNEIVDRTLKLQDARRVGVSVTDREVAFILEYYPPDEVRQLDAFKREGKFDLQLYRQFLRRPEAANYIRSMEESIRRYLTEQAINFQVLLAADVSAEEVRDEFLKQTATGKLRFLAFLNDQMEVDSSLISEEMIQKYYRIYADRYKSPAQRRFAYVKFKVEPTREDSEAVRETAEELIRELKGGADFAQLAREYSEDEGSASQGGDLGWFKRGTMTPLFEEAVFKAPIGELVGPVETKFGLHIIIVEDRKVEDGVEQAKARHILLKFKPSADTREAVYSQASTFAQDAQKNGFFPMAQEYHYPVDTTRWFTEAGYITGLGRMRMAAQFCFNNPVGTISDVYPYPEGYVVFQIVEAVEEKPQPLEEVRDRVIKSLISILKGNMAYSKAVSVRARISSPEDLNRVASVEGLKVYESEDSLKPTGRLPDGLKKDSDFLLQAFRLKEGEISEVIRGDNGCYIAYMVRKSEPEEGNFKANYSVVYNNLVTNLQQGILMNWVRELRINGKIDDLRYRFFRDF